MQEGAYAPETGARTSCSGASDVSRRCTAGEGFVSPWRLPLLCLVVAGIVIAVTASGDHRAGRRPRTSWSGGAARRRRPVAATGEERPAFARLGDRNLLLPVAAGDATIIAYQPVSDERAVALTPIGDQANANALVRFFRGIFSSEPSVRYYLLDGAGGEPTSSVLVGAAAGLSGHRADLRGR